MKYFLVAGEASGDLHASNLMKSLKEIDPGASFRFLGGDLMQAVGGDLLLHYRDMAYMGFIPVLMNLGSIFRNLDLCKREIAAWHPDVVILVDYPGFNLKVAKYVRTRLQIPVYYYISPKIWAWKEWRIGSIRKYVDKMLCILPFEVDFYKKHHYPVDYVGNPTIDAIAERAFREETREEFSSRNHLPDRPLIALLAGSRRQEIKDNLPGMLEAVSAFPEWLPVIAGAPGIDSEYYRKYTAGKRVEIVFDQTYSLLQQADAALVTSGTATLETALFRVPQVVCYKTPVGPLVSFVWDHLFKVPYISLVNLIAGKTVVRELFGKYFSTENIRKELDRLLHNNEYRQEMFRGYDQVTKALGKPGASQQAARVVFDSLPERK